LLGTAAQLVCGAFWAPPVLAKLPDMSSAPNSRPIPATPAAVTATASLARWRPYTLDGPYLGFFLVATTSPSSFMYCFCRHDQPP
jgi:hypothetical protein